VNKRALLVAFGVTVVGAILLFLYLRRFEQEASGGAPVALLVASKQVVPGTLLGEADLTVREIPAAYVETRAVRVSEKQRVLGLRVATRIEPEETLMWTDLAMTADDRRDLSGLVQPGMRAVTIHTRSGSDHTNQLIEPGDRVDIILTTGERGQETTIVLSQNVLVLAVGLDTGSESGEKREKARGDALTVSATIREAQLISLAGDRGRISVALRNPDDVRIVDGLVETTGAALVDARTQQQRPATPAPLASASTATPVRLEEAPVRRGAHR
jgi:pilus assembly protein CpaB